MTTSAEAFEGEANADDSREWKLRLYVSGQTPKSLRAFANLKTFCEQYLKGRYSIEVVDVVKNPLLAEGDQILAIPTLIRRLPEPIRRLVGDLADSERILVGLDLYQQAAIAR